MTSKSKPKKKPKALTIKKTSGYGRNVIAAPSKWLEPPSDRLKAINAARRRVEELHEAARLRAELHDEFEMES